MGFPDHQMDPTTVPGVEKSGVRRSEDVTLHFCKDDIPLCILGFCEVQDVLTLDFYYPTVDTMIIWSFFQFLELFL